MSGITKLNLTPAQDLTRPEMDDIKVRLHRVEVKEPPAASTTLAGIVPKATAPAANILNYLGINNGETVPSWQSASSNPGAAAAILATDASGYLRIVRLGLGKAPTHNVDAVGTISGAALISSGSGMVLSSTNTYGSFSLQEVSTTGFVFAVRANQTKNAFFGFTEDNVADRWVIKSLGGNGSLYFATGNSATNTNRVSLTDVGNVKIAGVAVRGTTEGTNHLDIFNGTAPAGTLANGISLYSTAGELRVMDAAGNATLLSPHDKQGNWIFDSKDTVTGRHLRIDVEKLLRAVNERFGLDFVKEYAGA